ncbi:MAG: hypothetical protein Kow0081_4220 [Candidatus Dojkabacteria bacterium]
MKTKFKTCIKQFFSVLLIVFISGFGLAAPTYAQNQSNFISAGKIVEITASPDDENPELIEKITKVEINENGKDIIVNVRDLNRPEFQETVFQVGDKVMVDKIRLTSDVPVQDLINEDFIYESDGSYFIYQITDFNRTQPLLILTVLFVALVIIVARTKGLFSLIGLLFSFLVNSEFLLSNILKGGDPLLVSIVASVIIIPVNYYLAHGLDKKTTYAIIGTIFTMIIIGLLTLYFVDWAKLSGLTSDEAGFLNNLTGGAVNIRDLLMAGIIVGILGILDDITISQSSIANQLKLTNPKIHFRELFFRTMEVGKDHIASLVNTLILVYTSAALPLLLLLSTSEASLFELINREIIAEEIIRTLLTSSGLILAVPVTSLISAYFIDKFGGEEGCNAHEHDMHHHH